MANKTFKGYVPESALTFELESADGERTVTIRCKPNVPGSKFLEFLSAAGPTSMENFGALAKVVREVLEVAINDEDVPAFWAFVDHPDNGIGLEQLSQIAGWLAEQFASERPTEPSPA